MIQARHDAAAVVDYDDISTQLCLAAKHDGSGCRSRHDVALGSREVSPGVIDFQWSAIIGSQAAVAGRYHSRRNRNLKDALPAPRLLKDSKHRSQEFILSCADGRIEQRAKRIINLDRLRRIGGCQQRYLRPHRLPQIAFVTAGQLKKALAGFSDRIDTDKGDIPVLVLGKVQRLIAETAGRRSRQHILGIDDQRRALSDGA